MAERLSEESAQMQERSLDVAVDTVKQKRKKEIVLAQFQECQSKIPMKKNIIILALIIISATLVIYSYIKANEAEKYQLELVGLNNQVIELMDNLNILQKRHIEAAAEVRMQNHLTEKVMKELQECQSN